MISKLNLILAALVALALSSPVAADDKTSASELVEEARFTVAKMADHPRHSDKIRELLGRAKAVFVVPQLLKGGFILGGEGGSGVLLARAENGEWSYPAFYSMGSGSIGFQFGAQASEVLLLVMTGKGLAAILENKVQLGGEISAAAGPVGEGLGAGTTTNMDADVLSYSLDKGAFLGFSVEGAVIFPAEDYNAAYYGNEAANGNSIVLNGQHHNPQADKLRQLLASFKN